MEGSWVAGISAALALYSLYQLARLVQRILHFRAGRGWPVTAGSVSAARVLSAGGEKRGRPPYAVEITCSYRAVGAAYRRQFQTGSSYPTEEKARQALASFPPGTAVQVRYDPENPQHSLTDFDRVKTSEWLQWLIFFILNAAVLVYAYFFW